MNELKIKPKRSEYPVTLASIASSTGGADTHRVGLNKEIHSRRRVVKRFLERFTGGRQLVAGDILVATVFGICWQDSTLTVLLGWLMAVLSYGSAGLYRPRLHLAMLDQLPQLLSRFVISMTVAATVPALLGVSLSLRSYATAAAVLLISQLTMRGSIFAAIRLGRGAGAVAHPTLLVGNSDSARKVADILSRHRSYGLKVIGYVADRPTVGAAGDDDWNYLGNFDEVAPLVQEHRVEILILDETSSNKLGLLDGLRHEGGVPSAFVMPRNWKIGTPRATDDHIGAVPILRLNRSSSFTQRSGKRLFDLFLATVALVILAPLMSLVAIIIVCEDGHGPLFRQVRVGRNGKLFTMYKFRSMKPAPSETSDTAWSQASELRIGRIGKFIRSTSIDELPQLFNILRGDMTFVGPRPERPHYVEQFTAMFPEYGSRHRVTVGLTGLAQVSGLRGDTSIDDRVRHDNYYIDHWNLWFDIKVLIWTLGQAFGARGS